MKGRSFLKTAAASIAFVWGSMLYTAPHVSATEIADVSKSLAEVADTVCAGDDFGDTGMDGCTVSALAAFLSCAAAVTTAGGGGLVAWACGVAIAAVVENCTCVDFDGLAIWMTEAFLCYATGFIVEECDSIVTFEHFWEHLCGGAEWH